jgi:hypothetical protein
MAIPAGRRLDDRVPPPEDTIIHFGDANRSVGVGQLGMDSTGDACQDVQADVTPWLATWNRIF